MIQPVREDADETIARRGGIDRCHRLGWFVLNFVSVGDVGAPSATGDHDGDAAKAIAQG